MKLNFINFIFSVDKTSFLCYHHTHKMKFDFIINDITSSVKREK